MGLLLYKVLLIKEFIYGLLIKGLAGLVVFIEAGHVPGNWIFLALIMISLFPLSTFILKEIRNIWPDNLGFLFAGLSMLKMLLIPVLIILFFDKSHADVEAFVIPAVVGYLILMGLDTKWKIQWLFSKRN